MKPPAAPVPDTRTTVNDAAQDGERGRRRRRGERDLPARPLHTRTAPSTRLRRRRPLDPADRRARRAALRRRLRRPGSWANAVASDPRRWVSSPSVGPRAGADGSPAAGTCRPRAENARSRCSSASAPTASSTPTSAPGGLLRLRRPRRQRLSDAEAESVIAARRMAGCWSRAPTGWQRTGPSTPSSPGSSPTAPTIRASAPAGWSRCAFPVYERARRQTSNARRPSRRGSSPRGLRSRRPRFSMRLGSRLPWAQIESVRISLPHPRAGHSAAGREVAGDRAAWRGKWVAAPSSKANKRRPSDLLRATGVIRRRFGSRLRRAPCDSWASAGRENGCASTCASYFTHEGRSAGDSDPQPSSAPAEAAIAAA